MDCLSASQFPYGMCKQGACNFDAFILWSDHKIDLCPSCALMFHYRWKLKISNESNYIDNAIKIIKCLVNSMEIHEQKYKYSKLELGFKAEIKNISESFESLISQIKEASKYDLQNLIQNIHDIMGSLVSSLWKHYFCICYSKQNRIVFKKEFH